MDYEDGSVRLRSTQNASFCAKESDKGIDKIKVLQPDKPCHKQRESLLSLTSTHIDYKGALNFAIAILVLSNIYVALENIKMYGLLIDPVEWLKLFFYKSLELPVLLIWFGLNLFAFCSLGLEILLSKGLLGETCGLTFITFLLTSELLIGPVVVGFTDCFAVAFAIILGFITVFLKLVSYHIVNYWCRRCYVSTSNTAKPTVITDENVKNGVINLVRYPDNLNLKDMFYYLYAPTLCYELNFPRSVCVKKGFLMKCLLEVLLVVLIMTCTIQQSIAPVVNDALNSIQDMDYYRMFEIYLKLCIPFALVWLSYAYGFFHSYFNTVAEILRFGDRKFYSDWWNSDNQQHFFKKWNLPVHNWCVRHLYKPLLKEGFTRFQAVAVVFFISAFFHEYLLSAPLQIFKVWIFVTYHFNMLSTLKKKSSSKFGNLMLWSTMIFGPPFSTLFYYYYYYLQNIQKREIS